MYPNQEKTLKIQGACQTQFFQMNQHTFNFKLVRENPWKVVNPVHFPNLTKYQNFIYWLKFNFICFHCCRFCFYSLLFCSIFLSCQQSKISLSLTHVYLSNNLYKWFNNLIILVFLNHDKFRLYIWRKLFFTSREWLVIS